MVRENEEREAVVPLLNPPLKNEFKDVDNLGPGSWGRRALVFGLAFCLAAIVVSKCTPPLKTSCLMICYSQGTNLSAIDEKTSSCYCYGDAPPPEDMALP